MRCILAMLLLGLTGLLLVGVGGGLAAEQASLLSAHTKVSGLVTESRVLAASTGGYQAKIIYDYQVNGKTHQSGRLTPIPVAGTETWAHRVVKRYPPGSRVEVFHAPGEPARAFLERYPAFYPYAIILLGIAALAMGPALALAGGLLDYPPRPRKTSEAGWIELAELQNPAMRGMAYALLGLALIILPVLVYLHFAATAQRFLSFWLIALLPLFICAALSLRTAMRTIRPMNIFRRFVVATTLEQVDLNKPVNARVQIQAERPIVLEELRISLVCDERSDFASERWFIASHCPRTGYKLTPEAPAVEKASFEVPKTKRRPSSTFERLAMPRLTWAFEVNAKVKGVGTYRMQHPFVAIVRTKVDDDNI